MRRSPVLLATLAVRWQAEAREREKKAEARRKELEAVTEPTATRALPCG